MRSYVGRVTALRDDTGVGPLGAVGVELLLAVGLVFILALPAVEAGIRLGSDADALAGPDQGDLGSNTESGADNFYTASPNVSSLSL